MIQIIQKYRQVSELHRAVLFGGILIFLFLAPKLLRSQVVPGNFDFEGINRTYLVYIPANYTGTEDFPLLIFLHPYSWNGLQGMDYTNFNQVADTADFMVVYPDAIPNWNSGINDNPNWPAPSVNDVGFINALIDTLINQYNIYSQKIYACGYSNGGFMSYKLACQLSNRIAAIASVCGVISTSTLANCEPANTIPVLQIHGTADAVVPINGTNGWHSVDETLNNWIDLNNCSEVDTISLPDIDPSDGCTVEKISYTNCTDNKDVFYYKVINGGHTWPGAGTTGLPIGNTNQDINASVEIWNFFKNYPPISCLPEGIIFSNQAQIDNFNSNYPDCTEIKGGVLIEGNDISNLDGLSIVTSIGGYL